MTTAPGHQNLAAKWSLGLAAMVFAVACSTITPAPRAPRPMKYVDETRLYVARWYEIARTRERETSRCMARTADFSHNPRGRLVETDRCPQKLAARRITKRAGLVDILDPGANAKIRVTYSVSWSRFYPIVRTYWVQDHGETYDWVILSDPDFRTASILSRKHHLSPAEIAPLTARLAKLGFDVSRLEYPKPGPDAEPPASRGETGGS